MMRIDTQHNSTRVWLCCAAVLVLVFALPTAAQTNGNIFTTNAAGSTVNGNIYTSKADVYLTGGPKNCKNGSGLTAGTYFFQVTAPPSGTNPSDVLSEDSIYDRQFTADGEFISAYTWTSGGGGSATLNTSTGAITLNPSNATPPHAVTAIQVCTGGYSLGIQLKPYADTPNTGGEYKVWACQDAGTDNCQQVESVPATGSLDDGSCGDTLNSDVHQLFPGSGTKTDNFKVGCTPGGGGGPVLWPISGIKFYDTNGNGVQDPGEPGIPNWQIVLYASSNTISGLQPTFPAGGFAMATDSNGNFTTDNNPTADKPVAGGVYGVCETIPPSANTGFQWTSSPACPNTYFGNAAIHPLNFNYGGTYSDTNSDTDGVNTYLHNDVTFSDPLQYASGYALQYPVTATGGIVVNAPHLGIPYANCGTGYYNNIDDVFDRTALSGAYGNNPLITFNDGPGTGSPLFTDGVDLTTSTWNHEFPGAVFGNYCKNTPAGGLTKGFWSNKNGAFVLGAITGSGYVDGLSDPSNSTPLHFVGQSLDLTCTSSTSCAAGTKSTWNSAYLPTPGTAGTPFSGGLICSTTSSSCLDYWLTNGSNSANAANQLSVQMVAAVLNINKGAAAIAGGFLTGPALTTGTYVYAQGSNCAAAANLGGYATLGCVITEANTVLGLQQSDFKWAYTPSTSNATCNVGGALGTVLCRSYETNLQNILNNVNNNIAGPTPPPAAGIALCGVSYTNVAACTVSPINHP